MKPLLPFLMSACLLTGCTSAQLQSMADSLDSYKNSVADFFTPESQKQEAKSGGERIRTAKTVDELDAEKQKAKNKKSEPTKEELQKRQEQIDHENAQYAEENWQMAKPLLGTADAIPYLIEAGKFGHPEANYQLALAFLYGHGVNKHYQQAEILMGDAARAKHPPAQYMFASLLLNRAQTTADPNEIYIFLPRAYAWYVVAERNGIEAATGQKNKIKKILTRKVYGPDAGMNAYLWSECQRLAKDGLSKYVK